MLAVLAAGATHQLAWRFLRVVAVIALGLLAWAVAWRILQQSGAFASDRVIVLAAAGGGGAAVLLLLAPFAQRHAAWFRTVSALAGLAGLAGAAFAALEIRRIDHPAAIWLVAIGQVLSGLFLGSITLSWLLGHAYLTATKMTIAPLRFFTAVLTWATAARMVFVLISGLIAWRVMGDQDATAHAPSLWQWVHRSWLIVFLRIAVGLGLVSVFVWMVRDCVRLRSTQSATGILYFGSVFAYVGELAALQLLREWAWPM